MRLLEEAAGPPTREQIDLAGKVGLVYAGEPRGVFSEVIEAWLRPTIWQKGPDPATERQLAFLGALGHAHKRQDISRRVASAWIEHYLSLRTASALKELRLVAGDAVSQEHSDIDSMTGEIHVWYQPRTVSSIGENGLVYFRGGNGQCGWPSLLRRPVPQCY